MKSGFRTLAVLAALACSATAGAECIYPRTTADVPDGKTATQEQIVAAMNAVKRYNEEINAYLNCLQTESDAQIAALPDPTPEQIRQIKGIQTAKHNAAVDELEAYATRFNEQLRAYKARNPG